VIKAAAGYYAARSTNFRTATQAVDKANQYATRDRKARKRQFRALWIQRINAAVRLFDAEMTYSRLINGLAKAGIEVDRKVLADLAVHEPEAFNAIAGQARGRTGRPPRRRPWQEGRIDFGADVAGLGKMDPDQRKAAGAMLNVLKDEIDAALRAKKAGLADAALDARLRDEWLDVTLPGRPRRARHHPPGQPGDGRTDRHLRRHGLCRRRRPAGRIRLV
jgi:large subunit ribosomal protein L20